MIRKGQVRNIGGSDIRAQAEFIAGLFGVAALKKFQVGIRSVDMSDVMDDRTAGSMVPRCAVDLKPGVCDASLRGFGA